MDRLSSGHQAPPPQQTPSEAQRWKPRRVTTPSKAEDLFLELANDTEARHDKNGYARQTNSRVYEREKTSAPPIVQPSAPTSVKTDTKSKQYPSNLSYTVSSPPPPNTAPPVTSEKYFRNLHQSSLSPEYRRASAGEASVSMRPFKPTYRPSQLSTQAFQSPNSVDSGYSEVIANTIEQSPVSPSFREIDESVGSVTAASTVWDDAEDLRSKIKQYRSTSRRIRSSGANVDLDRPRTATTTTTTSSLSHPSAHANGSFVDGSAKHQLLRKALQRLQGHVDTDVFRSLEASVADVISASSVLDISDVASTTDNGSTVTGRGSNDRRLRRKIDSLCQNLTDLCIALRDSNDHTATLLHSPELVRPTSNGSASRTVRETPSPNIYLEQRRTRIGSGSRAPSRISEASHSVAPPSETTPSLAVRQSAASRQSQARPRRLSIADSSPTAHLDPRSHLSGLTSTRTLSQAGSTTTVSGPLSPGASSSGRTSTIRAPSRAATEAPAPPTTAPSSFMQRRPSSHERGAKKSSRDYIDRHPLPDSISPSVRKTLAANQSNVSLNSAYSASTFAGAGGDEGSGGRSQYLQERLEKRRREQAEQAALMNGGARDGLGAPGRDERRARTLSGAGRERPVSRGIGYG